MLLPEKTVKDSQQKSSLIMAIGSGLQIARDIIYDNEKVNILYIIILLYYYIIILLYYYIIILIINTYKNIVQWRLVSGSSLFHSDLE